ncbi:uncharacterized protein EV422DRAFT_564041 [Fimicolochytrium jonesii]|uniref:uncharacterized protein n=1 Tax=Fimicolochytrium jonesii TaxID=1396493 RepID=UPI0022FF2DF2|nr:uncharacterized protein EV422DRAFT_564041 [Fimicolochytrium jonesii]KAI8826229.1 hypothetical protein EV422DRAFT_564041 [Fimicolochytrium jonesii]
MLECDDNAYPTWRMRRGGSTGLLVVVVLDIVTAWNSALPAQERCLIKYDFEELDGIGCGRVFNNAASLHIQALDTNAYSIWDGPNIAYLTSEFGFLSTMQSEFLSTMQSDLRGIDSDKMRRYHPNAPKDMSQWSALSADLAFLAGPLQVIGSEYTELDGTEHIDRSTGYNGEMAFPLLLSAVPELDDPSDAVACNALLARLQVSEHLRGYYGIRRISLADEDAVMAFLVRLFEWDRRFFRGWFSLENDAQRQTLMRLHQALKDDNIVELIDEGNDGPECGGVDDVPEFA